MNRYKNGKNQKRLPIKKADLGNGNRRAFFGCFSWQHANGTSSTLGLFVYLKNETNMVKTKELTVVNPDGLTMDSRINADGADINRNFPTKNWIPDKEVSREYFSASKIETKIFIKMVEQENLPITISIHRGGNGINYDGPTISCVKKLSQITGFPIKRYIGYSTPGGLGTYAGIERAIPTITFEFPREYNYPGIETKYFPALQAVVDFL